MSHSDDDGLVARRGWPPLRAINYRSPEEKTQVMPYVESLRKELAAQDFAGEKVRVFIDDRDLRGGEKNWQHIKRGVPLRAEIGPKDIAKNGVFLARFAGEKAGGTRSLVGRLAVASDSRQFVCPLKNPRRKHADNRRFVELLPGSRLKTPTRPRSTVGLRFATSRSRQKWTSCSRSTS
jgi:hypothetical protein